MIRIVPNNGNRSVFVKIAKMPEDNRRGIRQGFFLLGTSLRRTASKQILAKNKTGRLYRIRRGKRIRNHRASAPGESPANLSGNYRRNLGFQIYGFSRMEFGGRAEYSDILEENLNRPGLGNAVKAEERNSITYFRSSIQKFMT